jgi:hypothetical protein
MLGTNDTCGPPRHNWGKSAAFAGDAAAMLRSLAKPGRRIIIALPPPMVHDRPGLRPERAADLRERAPRLAAIRDWWRQEAAKLGVEVVDLTNIFDSDPRWTTDGVHPTPAGYDRIANRIAETIRGAKGAESAPDKTEGSALPALRHRPGLLKAAIVPESDEHITVRLLGPPQTTSFLSLLQVPHAP